MDNTVDSDAAYLAGRHALIKDAIEILLIATIYSSELQAKRSAVIQGMMDLLKGNK